jgi:hypothetical protein
MSHVARRDALHANDFVSNAYFYKLIVEVTEIANWTVPDPQRSGGWPEDPFYTLLAGTGTSPTRLLTHGYKLLKENVRGERAGLLSAPRGTGTSRVQESVARTGGFLKVGNLTQTGVLQHS